MSETQKQPMVDIISAKCFGCGHVVKVPAALGGKKAKCPQCAQVITIPTQADTHGEFVSDEMLPEVARDEDVVQGLPVEEGDEVLEGEPVEEPAPGGGRLRSMTPRRGTPAAARGGRRGSGAHQKVPAHGAYAPPRKSSAAPLVIGVVLGAVALVVILVVALSGRPGGKAGQDQEKPPPPPPPQVTEADTALQRRCAEYVSVFNRRNVLEIMKFYSCGPGEEQKIKGAISAMLEQGACYDEVAFKSASAAGGTVTFHHAKGEKTINWRLADGVWLIADKP